MCQVILALFPLSRFYLLSLAFPILASPHSRQMLAGNDCGFQVRKANFVRIKNCGMGEEGEKGPEGLTDPLSMETILVILVSGSPLMPALDCACMF